MHHPAALPLDELAKDCRFHMLRRSGPGGQHRNKVETAVVVKHLPSEVSAEANERRSQAENRREALRRLRVNLALEVRSDLQIDSAPTSLWQSRTVHGKIIVSPRHDDFPALLAEALDRVAVAEWEVKTAAEHLSCSASQLIKLLKIEARALALVNVERTLRGLHELK